MSTAMVLFISPSTWNCVMYLPARWVRVSIVSATVADDVGQPELVGLHIEPLGPERIADRLDDLGHRVGLGVGDPPAPSGLGGDEFGAHDALDKVVDVGHRSNLADRHRGSGTSPFLTIVKNVVCRAGWCGP